MKIGFDTGFFVRLIVRDPKAVKIWKKVISGEVHGVTSCLTLFEISRLSVRGVLKKEKAKSMIEIIPAACSTVWLSEAGLLKKAAALSVGAGLPSLDALILASLLEAGVERIYTTDRDFETYNKKGVEIINLRR